MKFSSVKHFFDRKTVIKLNNNVLYYFINFKSSLKTIKVLKIQQWGHNFCWSIIKRATNNLIFQFFLLSSLVSIEFLYFLLNLYFLFQNLTRKAKGKSLKIKFFFSIDLILGNETEISWCTYWPWHSFFFHSCSPVILY